MSARKREALANYRPLPKVEGWHRSDARFRLIIGGNRSGKTTAGAIETAWWGTGEHPYLKVPTPCKILCVENTWSLVGDPMWRKLSKPQGLKGPGASSEILASRYVDHVAYMSKQLNIPEKVILKNGSTIDFRSADAGREKFEGAEFDFVWIDEEVSDSEVYQEIQRGLVDRGGRLIWTATPLGRSRAMLELHEEAQDGCPEVCEVQLSIFDNPYLDDAAREAFVERVPEDRRETRLFGAFLILEGLVYGEWDRDMHEMSRKEFAELDPRNPRVVVVDPGYAHPCAVLWFMMLRPEQGQARKSVAYREYYQKRRTVSETVKAIARLSGGEPLTAAIIDRESLKTNQSGAKSLYEQYNAAFKECGLTNSVTGGPLRLQLAATDIESGIYTVKEFLMPGYDGVPGFRIVDDMVHLKHEIGRYRWGDETDNKDIPKKPVDRDNHLLDDVRYFHQNMPPYREVQSEQYSASKRIYDYAQKVMAGDKGTGVITIGG